MGGLRRGFAGAETPSNSAIIAKLGNFGCLRPGHCGDLRILRDLVLIENPFFILKVIKKYEFAGTKSKRLLKRRWFPIANTPTLISCAEAAPAPCICCRPFS